MEATKEQERYILATEYMREVLASGEGPRLDDGWNDLSYRRWKTFNDLLDNQKELLKEMDQLERTFRDARPYLEGGNGYFNERGLVQQHGSRIDVLTALFRVRVDAAIQVEMDYQEARGS